MPWFDGMEIEGKVGMKWTKWVLREYVRRIDGVMRKEA